MSIDLINNNKKTVVFFLLTYHKPESVLQVDLPDPSVALEELLHVPLPGMRAEAADEHTTAAHGALTAGREHSCCCSGLVQLYLKPAGPARVSSFQRGRYF